MDAISPFAPSSGPAFGPRIEGYFAEQIAGLASLDTRPEEDGRYYQ
jgi:hypothetical protein